MAWLEIAPTGNYHLAFRYQDTKFKRSLKTRDWRQAETIRCRVEENVSLVEAGRLVVPDNADVSTFLLSDGVINSAAAKPYQRLLQGELYAEYEASLPADALAAETLRITKIQLGHFSSYGPASAPHELTEVRRTLASSPRKAKTVRKWNFLLDDGHLHYIGQADRCESVGWRRAAFRAGVKKTDAAIARHLQ